MVSKFSALIPLDICCNLSDFWLSPSVVFEVVQCIHQSFHLRKIVNLEKSSAMNSKHAFTKDIARLMFRVYCVSTLFCSLLAEVVMLYV